MYYYVNTYTISRVDALHIAHIVHIMSWEKRDKLRGKKK